MGISLLFDPHFCQSLPSQPSSHHIPETSELVETIASFKQTLEVDDTKAREIERNTREQRLSLWFSMRKYRITASLFGAVLMRRPETPPDNLVLQIIQPKQFSTPALQYGIDNEKLALQEYIAYQNAHGYPNLLLVRVVFWSIQNIHFLVLHRMELFMILLTHNNLLDFSKSSAHTLTEISYLEMPVLTQSSAVHWMQLLLRLL